MRKTSDVTIEVAGPVRSWLPMVPFGTVAPRSITWSILIGRFWGSSFWAESM